METFSQYLQQIKTPQHLKRADEIFNWVKNTFKDLQPKIAWNQPMFILHGTFIIAFSISKQHLAVSPEQAGMEQFKNEIANAGYGQSKMLFRIKWDEPVDYELLEKIIKFNISDKAACTTFWRKQ